MSNSSRGKVKIVRHPERDLPNNLPKSRGNFINRTYKLIQSKIIQHAIPDSDWPAPQLIFGSKPHCQNAFSKTKSDLKCHNEKNGSVRTNCKDMSTIVSGFMQFEKNFKRQKGFENIRSSQKLKPKSEMKDREPKPLSITIPSGAIDPDSLGAAIEHCLKQKLNQ